MADPSENYAETRPSSIPGSRHCSHKNHKRRPSYEPKGAFVKEANPVELFRDSIGGASVRAESPRRLFSWCDTQIITFDRPPRKSLGSDSLSRSRFDLKKVGLAITAKPAFRARPKKTTAAATAQNTACVQFKRNTSAIKAPKSTAIG